MWFKNLCIYRLSEPFRLDAEGLQEKLAEFAFQPVGRTEMAARGWVPPLGRHGQQLVHATNGNLMVCLQEESRLLPPAVLREELDERVAQREEQEMRKLGRREKNRMKEELTLELLPRAFTRNKRCFAYIDPHNGWVVVDTGNWRQAEELTELLRACLGSFPVRPLQTDRNPQSVMTEWLARDRAPGDIELGDEAVLEDPQSEGAEVRVKRQDLHSGEIKGHLSAGKRVRRMAVTWDERLAAVLDSDLSVKRLKFQDVVQDDTGDREAESNEERFDADFAILALELGRFVPRLLELFGGEPAESKPEPAAETAQ
jgi:recombination associated protein RdgC